MDYRGRRRNFPQNGDTKRTHFGRCRMLTGIRISTTDCRVGRLVGIGDSINKGGDSSSRSGFGSWNAFNDARTPCVIARSNVSRAAPGFFSRAPNSHRSSCVVGAIARASFVRDIPKATFLRADSRLCSRQGEPRPILAFTDQRLSSKGPAIRIATGREVIRSRSRCCGCGIGHE